MECNALQTRSPRQGKQWKQGVIKEPIMETTKVKKETAFDKDTTAAANSIAEATSALGILRVEISGKHNAFEDFCKIIHLKKQSGLHKLVQGCKHLPLLEAGWYKTYDAMYWGPLQGLKRSITYIKLRRRE